MEDKPGTITKISFFHPTATTHHARKAAKRSILISDVNKQKKVAFARLKSIVFSDETVVKAYPNGEITYYRAPTERTDVRSRRVQQGGSGQMLWGCVSFHA
jgi:hypothetical protein